MKLLTEYLERAVQLEALGRSEADPAFRQQLFEQAKLYRELAARRAKDYGLPPPSPPETQNRHGLITILLSWTRLNLLKLLEQLSFQITKVLRTYPFRKVFL
ncbi:MULTISPECIES: hypothetical protein [Bradyrhizobium]|uniref:hypothetical protein n=2 Tax=Bradyrhizobium TaxID=374 RepID=UPI0028A53188|nr:hypothetical protein [Bradyrhizobium sp. WYCCWR 12699]MDT4740311.1 hypothetical protein [Bradyrhizobium sp. WYCCWR 12699]